MLLSASLHITDSILACMAYPESVYGQARQTKSIRDRVRQHSVYRAAVIDLPRFVRYGLKPDHARGWIGRKPESRPGSTVADWMQK